MGGATHSHRILYRCTFSIGENCNMPTVAQTACVFLSVQQLCTCMLLQYVFQAANLTILNQWFSPACLGNVFAVSLLRVVALRRFCLLLSILAHFYNAFSRVDCTMVNPCFIFQPFWLR